MIPGFDSSKAREISLENLLPELDSLNPGEDSLKHQRRIKSKIKSLDLKEIQRLNELPENSDEEAAQKIRNFRKTLNLLHNKCMEKGYSIPQSYCSRRDFYWAKREMRLTGKDNNYKLEKIGKRF